MVRLIWAPPEENLSPNVSSADEALGKPIEEGLMAGTVLFIKSGHQIIVSFSPLTWMSDTNLPGRRFHQRYRSVTACGAWAVRTRCRLPIAQLLFDVAMVEILAVMEGSAVDTNRQLATGAAGSVIETAPPSVGFGQAPDVNAYAATPGHA
jgi:hypothetical protein